MKYAALLQKLNPAAESLLAALSKHVDDEMLMSIALIDYGMNTEEHFAALCQIRDDQVVFAPMEWEPKEVLSLTLWSNPGKLYEGQIISDEKLLKEHLIRAFAAAALLRAMKEPPNSDYFNGDNHAIAVLLDSLSALAPSIQREALRFFAWSVQTLADWNASENPFYVLALLVLVLRTRAALTHNDLKAIIRWVFAEVNKVREYPSKRNADHKQWLPWLTLYDMRHEMWQKIGLEIMSLADQYPENCRNLKALARHLETIKA